MNKRKIYYEQYYNLDTDRKLYNIAKTYHEACNTFDSSITVADDNMPITTEEYEAIQKNAKRVLRQLQRDNPEYSLKQIKRAIQQHAYLY